MATAFKRFPYGRFGGGINTSVPAKSIADDECVDILNKEFNEKDDLITRRGVTPYSSALPVDTSKRITSIYDYLKADGSQFLLSTWGDDLRSVSESAATSIKGSLDFPTDTLWQWVTFNDVAIGANGGTSEDNPIQWDGTGNASLLSASAPKLRYIETWNNRVFGVDAENPNRLVWCKLGDATDWTDPSSGALEVGYDDGDFIIGIKAHKTLFFIFKNKRIYYIKTGTPNTDPNLWKLDLFTGEAGCVSASTIQVVLDDLLFLSDSGVASLQAVQQFGDFAQSVVSRKVEALKNFERTIPNHCAIVDPQNSQYWCAIPSSTSGTENGQVYVFDFKRLDEQRVRWSRFNGEVTGSAYAQVLVEGKKRVFVGTTGNQIYRYGDEDNYSDNGTPYTKSVITKAYDQGDYLIRKEYNRWFASVVLITCPMTLNVRHRFDEKDFRAFTQSFTFSCNGDGSGIFSDDDALAALWDIAIWDDDGSSGNGYLFGGDLDDNSSAIRDIVRKFNRGEKGKRGQTVQFFFTNAQDSEAFILTDLVIDATSIGTKRVNDTP